MASASVGISVVVPVYGCQPCLKRLYSGVRDALEHTDESWQLVLVDDRSPDAAWNTIVALAAEDKRVLGVRLARNHGQHRAIWTGLQSARGEWTVVMDCDLQDDPALIPMLLNEVKKSTAHACVVQRGQWSDTALRRLASNSFYKALSLLSGIRISNSGNYGIYSRTLIDYVLQHAERDFFFPAIVQLSGVEIKDLKLDRSQRGAGESSYTFTALIKLAANIAIAHSNRPLHLSIISGLTLLITTGGISLAILIGALSESFTVPGWASSIIAVCLTAGSVLAMLGIQGLYIGRIFDSAKGRPLNFVEEDTSDHSKTQAGRNANHDPHR